MPRPKGLRACLYAVLLVNFTVAILQICSAHLQVPWLEEIVARTRRARRNTPTAPDVEAPDIDAAGEAPHPLAKAASLGQWREVVEIDDEALARARAAHKENLQLARLREGAFDVLAEERREAEAAYNDAEVSDAGNEGTSGSHELIEVPRLPLREYAFELGGVSAVHVVVTRVLLGQASEPALVDARVRLFSSVCAPSIKRQRDARFVWLVYADPELPARAQRQLVAATASHGYIYLLFTRELVHLRSVSAQLRFVADAVGEQLSGLERLDRYISTRLDSDDALHADYLAQVQARLPLMRTGLGAAAATSSTSFALFVCSHQKLHWTSALHNRLRGELRRVREEECFSAGLSLLTVGYFNSSVLALSEGMVGPHNTEVLSHADWVLQSTHIASATLNPRTARDMVSARAAHWHANSSELEASFGLSETALMALNRALFARAADISAELYEAAARADGTWGGGGEQQATSKKKKGKGRAPLACGHDGTVKWSQGSLPCSHDAKGAWKWLSAQTAPANASSTAGGRVSATHLLRYYTLPELGAALDASAWLEHARADEPRPSDLAAALAAAGPVRVSGAGGDGASSQGSAGALSLEAEGSDESDDAR
mmetsp:Transcript_23946/g.61698  ORF Transcript_23946/g.61698 Transcript_23946/m.61698 type:complete len:606 (+) Transcript_23946:70-1887(+)